MSVARDKAESKENTISIVHVAQRHWHHIEPRIPEEDLLRHAVVFFHEDISQSQFNIALTIIANRGAFVFNEGFTEIQSPESRESDANRTRLAKIKQVFPNGFPAHYKDLTLDQRQMLIYFPASSILQNLGIIDYVYPTTTEEGAYNTERNLKKTNYNFHLKLARKLVGLYKPTDHNSAIHKVIYDDREELALNQVVENCGQSSQLVLLIYGAGHDFEKAVQQRSKSLNMVYLGRIETSDITKKLPRKHLPMGAVIIPGQQYEIPVLKFKDILSRYRTVYSSTSMFASGYQSSAMKALARLLNQAEVNHHAQIGFMDIYDVIAKSGDSQLNIFLMGEPLDLLIKTATDKVILDLHKVFKSFTPAKFEEQESKSFAPPRSP